MTEESPKEPLVNGETTPTLEKPIQTEAPKEEEPRKTLNTKNTYPSKYKYGFWFLFFFMGVRNKL